MSRFSYNGRRKPQRRRFTGVRRSDLLGTNARELISGQLRIVNSETKVPRLPRNFFSNHRTGNAEGAWGRLAQLRNSGRGKCPFAACGR